MTFLPPAQLMIFMVINISTSKFNSNSCHLTSNDTKTKHLIFYSQNIDNQLFKFKYKLFFMYR